MKYLILFLISTHVFATDTIYRIKDRSVIMSQENGVIANRDCFKNKSSCQAWKQASKHAKDKHHSSGKNPWAEKCKHVLKGEVVIGTDESQNENSFCLFSDQSVISCGSLGQF